MYKKILIANRGEIACRVIRTARDLGYRTVAVYSDADAAAPHVSLADEAVHIGPSPAAESYLRADIILDACRRTGADAIHPGYGFLSENAAFAQAVADAGLVFIGPPASAIVAMGDKAGAKARMIQADVPTAPGYLGADQAPARLKEEALKLGFPLLVKAVAGGGGRGMRLVRQDSEIDPAIEGAKREAVNAFGDGTLMLERLIDNGRHIEIQVFADAHGNAVYLGERDCTAQRRRQKVIEEAPSPVVSAEMRARMGRDAVAAALAVGYRGAGTIEFIVDEQLNYYFLEMNTRLQVEHPVTELITGFDLVEWQLRVAAGQPLPVKQEDITLSGHAIEARLYAEDPYSGFVPQTGTVAWWRPQRALHDGVRVDDGIREGSVVSPFYDAMVAKLIVRGRDRDDAIRRLIALTENAPLIGLRHNARFLRDLVDHPAFREARMTTTLLDQWYEAGEPLLQRPVAPESAWPLAAALLASSGDLGAHGQWRSGSVSGFDIVVEHGEDRRTLRIAGERSGELVVGSSRIRILGWHDGELRFVQDGITRQAVAVLADGALHLAIDAAIHVFAEASPFPATDKTSDPRRVLSPVAGKVVQVLVQPGSAVEPGQNLACVEAMKMEMWLTAQAPGTVAAVHAKAGEQVEAAALLIELELAAQPAKP
jgi:geranyl-CoA carboxylase alpha subunit